jgi:cell shape-determining protein MreD
MIALTDKFVKVIRNENCFQALHIVFSCRYFCRYSNYILACSHNESMNNPP